MAWASASGTPGRLQLGWADVFVLGLLFAVLFGLVQVGHSLAGPLPSAASFSLSPTLLPYYALRSVLRLLAAFALSLVFTFVYGYAAARSRRLEGVLVSFLDILQSVPVLGFLAVSVTVLARLLPSPELGLELAAVFAIFTAQAWNMTFSFYHSLRTLPRDLDEACRLYRVSPWLRLWRFEVPYATIGLVLNSMMSFGGSWFFLAASETFTYRGRAVALPGLGSYLAEAQARGNAGDMLYAIAAMVVVIVVIDQLFWRPVVAWSQRFKMEEVPAAEEPRSFVLTALRRSLVIRFLSGAVLGPAVAWVEESLARRFPSRQARSTHVSLLRRGLEAGLLLLVGGLASRGVVDGAAAVVGLGAAVIGHVLLLGVATFLRVAAAVVLGALWTVPVGVAVGLSPRINRYAQPLAQIAASFPANMLFPFLLLLYLRIRLGLSIGAIPLMMLGTQWYILFNVMAGAMAIPADLREAATVFALGRWRRWRDLILPAIFPALVTGGITAAGGAWNASIVAEVVAWHGRTVTAAGLGSLITEAAAQGHTALLLLGILVMSLYVVLTNRLVWRPLYRLAEVRYHVG